MKGTSVRELGDREGTGYPLEELEQLVKPLINSPSVDIEGENVGFYIDSKGQHIGALLTIANSLGTSTGKIKKAAENQELEGVWIRDRKGKLVTGYSLEEVRNLLGNYLELPTVKKNGEHRGFYFDPYEGVFFGAGKTIAQKLGVPDTRISSIINEYEVKRTVLRDLTGKVVTGYDPDEIASLLEGFLQLPSVAETGEYKGFYQSPDGHYFGAVNAITNILNISSDKVKRVIKECKIESVMVRTIGGTVRKGYSLKEIEDVLASEK